MISGCTWLSPMSFNIVFYHCLSQKNMRFIKQHEVPWWTMDHSIITLCESYDKDMSMTTSEVTTWVTFILLYNMLFFNIVIVWSQIQLQHMMQHSLHHGDTCFTIVSGIHESHKQIKCPFVHGGTFGVTLTVWEDNKIVLKQM